MNYRKIYTATALYMLLISAEGLSLFFSIITNVQIIFLVQPLLCDNVGYVKIGLEKKYYHI